MDRSDKCGPACTLDSPIPIPKRMASANAIMRIGDERLMKTT